MIKKTNLAWKKTTVLLILSVFLFSFISSYGVSAPYWKGHPITIAPGDTKTVSITLQQGINDGDVTVNVNLKKGSEIASIREGEYFVGAGTKDTEILVTITIPEEVPLETSYEVTLASAQVVSGGGGGVSLGVAIDTTFDVLVADVTRTKKQDNTLLIAIIIILILVVLFAIFFMKKKKRKR